MDYKILENSEWKITLSTVGGELVSAIRKSDGREYMWEADPEVWKRHAPILFPLVGKYRNNTSFFDGKEYYMTQHGFARDMEFEVEEYDGTGIVMSLCENEQTLAKYPFKFKLSLTYKLDKNKLTVGWTVENTNEREMYFSIGGHPAFVGKGKSLTGAYLVFETDKTELEYRILAESGYLGDDTDILTLSDKKALITENLFDRDALIIEESGCGKVSIEQDGERIVSLSFDAPLFGIWSAAKTDNRFVCIEPWYGRIDREDFSGELSEREYGNTLEAGGVFKREYTIEFSE